MLRILHLEDGKTDAFLVERALTANGIPAQIHVSTNRQEFLSALELGPYDLVLADNALPGFSGTEALRLVEEKCRGTPVIFVSGAATAQKAYATLEAGAKNFVLKDQLWQLVAAVRAEQEKNRLARLNQARSRLVNAIQELSLARDLEHIMKVVRRTARELTGADGATFVLREGNHCYYADEDAIAPLWKGQRFPAQACISGWVMHHGQPAVIEDIYADPRIPAEAYRPTFVKSLAMVPIRAQAPIGAIGNYWATQRAPLSQEVELLQALANTTAVAMENVQIYSELEQRVKARTAELELANKELETFSYAVSHDLAAPLRAMYVFADMLLEENAEDLTPQAAELVQRMRATTTEMSALISGLLQLSKFSKAPLHLEPVNLTVLAQEICSRLAAETPGRTVEVHFSPPIEVKADKQLMRSVLQNLLSNAFKYTSKTAKAVIEFGAASADPESPRIIYVRDNGAGFDMGSADRLFRPFHRLHSDAEFQGTGVGLATVQRIIQRHGGKIWVEAEPQKGATFYFTLG